MKRLLSFTLSVMAAGLIWAESPEITVIEGVDKLVVSSKTEAPKITQGTAGTKWGMEYPFVGTVENKGEESCCYLTGIKDIYWGWNFNYGKKGNIKNCFEVGVANVVGIGIAPFKKGPSFNIGLGFGMRRYLARDGYRFDREDNILTIPYGHRLDVTKSRLDSWTFHVPVMITQDIYKKLAVSVGAWLNFNTYVKGETQYFKNDVRYTEYYKGFNQRFFTVDIVAVVGLKNGIGFYGRVSPMSLFNNGYGPKFKSASMGVMLNF